MHFQCIHIRASRHENIQLFVSEIELMTKKGILIFQKTYPNIYNVFIPVIDQVIVSKEKEDFFYNLALAYGLIKDNAINLDEGLTHLKNMNLGQRHSFFKFLVTYLPNISLFPPCLNELEKALKNTNISFEDKDGTLNKLRNSDQFWGKYCELEAAAIFAKAGCKVRVLHRKKTGNKYPDLKVKFHSHNINVEVSNRIYKINKNSTINALRNKIEDEAAQLPENEFNIILFFVSNVPGTLGNVTSINRVTIFSFSDALFNDPQALLPVSLRKKTGIQKKKGVSILETNPKLRHINGVFIWYHDCTPIALLGKQTRTLIKGATKKNFPKEIMDVFCKIQFADIRGK